MSFRSLTLAAVGLVGTASASTLAIANKLSVNRASNIVEADLARIQGLKILGGLLDLDLSLGRRADGKTEDVGVTNNGVTYMMSVGVGSPAATYNLLVDTGSSNTWLNASKAYVPTSTSKSTLQEISVRYGSGGFSGTEYIDQVTLSDDLVIQNQSIGVASSTAGFDSSIDGILGIGPTDLTLRTLTANASTTIPTVVDSMFAQGLVDAQAFGISFEPVENSTLNEMNGHLTFGGADASKTAGALQYVPLTQTSPASKYWGVDQTVSYAGATLLDGAAGIVDTGTTLLYLATDAFQKYQNATGAELDSATGMLRIAPAAYAKLTTLDIKIGAEFYSLVPNAQIWPRSLNSFIGGDDDHLYLIVNDLGSPSGSGMDFINGYAWLERYYSVYDSGKGQLGFAATPWTMANLN